MKFRVKYVIPFLLHRLFSIAKTKIDSSKYITTKPKVLPKPEILTNGFIDVVNNEQLNASARFIRLYIGEPGKFAIPLSVYSGVSANNIK